MGAEAMGYMSVKGVASIARYCAKAGLAISIKPNQKAAVTMGDDGELRIETFQQETINANPVAMKMEVLNRST